MEQLNGMWGKARKDPGLGGPLGGLCDISFPRNKVENYICINKVWLQGELRTSVSFSGENVTSGDFVMVNGLN